MSEYRVVAISNELARRVRASRRAPGYGHPVYSEIATGYGPCRLCLRDFAVGADRRLLFTLDPFHGLEAFPLPGPVFIHETECARHPEQSGFPADLRSHDLTLAAYARGRLLAREDVDYLHVRDRQAGCYDLRIERGR
jgi:hypothetical protein